MEVFETLFNKKIIIKKVTHWIYKHAKLDI